MIRAALAMVAAALLLQLVGARDAVSVLSGTRPGSGWHALLGLAYAMAYFSAVVLAPILGSAGVIRRLGDLGRRASRR